MNKKLIDKNIHEFMHWLRGGSILVSEYCYDEYKYYDWTVVPSNSEWDYSELYKPRFVINDKYVKLRIAATEGKKIEVLDVDGKWKYSDIKSDSPFIYPVEDYRIKSKGIK